MGYKGTQASHEALQPRYGGEIVEEVVTIDGDKPSMRYNWANGYTVEMTPQGAYVTQFIDLETIARAGDSWPEEATLVRQVARDSRRNETSNRTETERAAALDLEFDLLFGVP